MASLLPAEKKSYLKILMAMACADGVIHENEKKILDFYGKKVGLKEDEIEEILKNPKSVKLIIPKTFDVKFDQLYDLATIMLIDGSEGEIEKKVFHSIANTFEFNAEQASSLFDMLKNGILQKKNKDQIKLDAKALAVPPKKETAKSENKEKVAADNSAKNADVPPKNEASKKTENTQKTEETKKTEDLKKVEEHKKTEEKK